MDSLSDVGAGRNLADISVHRVLDSTAQMSARLCGEIFMSRMSQAEFNAYEARRMAKAPRAEIAQSNQREAELHREILDECARRGWLPFHGSTAHKTFRTEGEPDFVILTNGGVLLVECKSKDGKLSMPQMEIAAWAKRLGHTVHVVRSLEQFISICV